MEQEKMAMETEKTRHELIQRDPNGNWQLKGVRWEDLKAGVTLTEEAAGRIYGALCKLKEYEETGHTPDRAREILEELDRTFGMINERYETVKERATFRRKGVMKWYRKKHPRDSTEKGAELADLIAKDLLEELAWLELLKIH